MIWAGSVQAAQLANVTAEEFFDQTPQLDPEVVARCEVAVEFDDNPINDAVVRVYGTLDGEVWDTVPVQEFVLEKLPGLTQRISFIVRDVYQFRIGVRSGSELKSADFSYRTSSVE